MHAQTCTCDEVLVVSDITCVCILINAFIYKVMLILEDSLIYYCAALARLQGGGTLERKLSWGLGSYGKKIDFSSVFFLIVLIFFSSYFCDLHLLHWPVGIKTASITGPQRFLSDALLPAVIRGSGRIVTPGLTDCKMCTDLNKKKQKQKKKWTLVYLPL